MSSEKLSRSDARFYAVVFGAVSVLALSGALFEGSIANNFNKAADTLEDRGDHDAAQTAENIADKYEANRNVLAAVALAGAVGAVGTAARSRS